MKKLGIICVLAFAAASTLISCQESSEKVENTIAIKIENKEALNDDEIGTMIDYVGEYAEKAQKYVDMEINDENSAEAMAGMTKLNEEYPYLSLYRTYIRFTPSSSLNAENLEKVGKYAGLVEFTAPAGYTIDTMGTQDAGLEEVAPQTDNGVVAGAEDNVKEELRNDW